MVTINIYKMGALFGGAIAMTLIDAALGIEFHHYPWWKSLAHKVAMLAWGAALVSF